jgi:uncharacterized protein (TIGR03067 family)
MPRLKIALLLILAMPGLAWSEGPVSGDLAKLQGRWTTKIGAEKNRPVTLAIENQTIVVKFTTPEGDTLDIQGELVLNESASPKTIDFIKMKNGGENMDDSLGLYKIEGETFTLCVGRPGEPRPSTFKGGDGDEPPFLWTFTRAK